MPNHLPNGQGHTEETDYDRGWSVQQTSDDGYIIAGATHSYDADACDVYFIKVGREVEI